MHARLLGTLHRARVLRLDISMESASRTKTRNHAILDWHLCFFFLALTFYYFAVLNVDYYKTGLLDLGWSDPALYFAQAKAMVKDGYCLKLRLRQAAAGRIRRAIGTDVSLAEDPSRADSILAPFRTNQTIGLLCSSARLDFTATLRCR